MPAHTLRDGNLRQMPRAVGPLGFERQQGQAATATNSRVRIPSENQELL